MYVREGTPDAGGSRQTSFEAEAIEAPMAPTARPRLSVRQKNVLALVLESGLAGPSLVSKELGVGISTAYRDLAMLEEVGLIASEAGKRTLTPEGLSYLGNLMNRS
jgi:Mn-dependent DtxR family transcriptional regulator